jgi:hypothetical protein
MKKHILLLALPLALLVACQGGASGQEEKKELETRVLAIHDEAMTRMDEIIRLRRTLRDTRDTLAARQADSTAILTLEREINGLDQADEAMMQWMRQYKAPDTLQHEQAMTYLQQELTKIQRVQTILDSTIAAARATTTAYEQEK